jgi:hypothetical protein
MPCNTITTQSVALAKAMPEIIQHAMKALGWNVLNQHQDNYLQARNESNLITWTPGKGINVQGYSNTQENIKALTKEYSKQAVTWAARHAGWNVKQTRQDTLTVSRR